jgi:hypothetical protein
MAVRGGRAVIPCHSLGQATPRRHGRSHMPLACAAICDQAAARRRSHSAPVRRLGFARRGGAVRVGSSVIAHEARLQLPARLGALRPRQPGAVQRLRGGKQAAPTKGAWAWSLPARSAPAQPESNADPRGRGWRRRSMRLARLGHALRAREASPGGYGRRRPPLPLGPRRQPPHRASLARRRIRRRRRGHDDAAIRLLVLRSPRGGARQSGRRPASQAPEGSRQAAGRRVPRRRPTVALPALRRPPRGPLRDLQTALCGSPPRTPGRGGSPRRPSARGRAVERSETRRARLRPRRVQESAERRGPSRAPRRSRLHDGANDDHRRRIRPGR